MLNPLNRSRTERFGFPELEGAFPLVGHAPAVAADLLGLLRDAERRLGPCFWINFGLGPDRLMCLGREGFDFFRSRTATTDHMREMARLFFGDSVLVHSGPKHQHLRSAMNPAFAPKGLAAAEVGPALAESARKWVGSWVGRRGVRILDGTRELALEQIFGLMGVGAQELPVWRRRFEAMQLFLIPLKLDLPGFPHWKARRAISWMDPKLEQLIDQARLHPDRPGLIPALLASKDEEGRELERTELVDNLRVLTFAGHQTTAATTAWIAIELARRPEVWAQLCAEAIDKEVPRTPQELKAFPYAEALFRETLRIHPALAITSRDVTVEVVLAGRPVPRGTLVAVSLLHLARDPAQFERPEDFLPERWLDRKTPISALELVPFGGGLHFCLGYHLAWMECVQFAVALAKALGPTGRRPQLDGPDARVRYYPLPQPTPSTRLRFDLA